MNRKQIQQQLEDHTLDAHSRETLQQLLHYMTVEGIAHTSSNKGNITNGSRTKSTRTAQAYKQSKTTTHKR